MLVEGDDLNEPVADSVRAILDGHIVLSRHEANRGHFPAIDPLTSVSRLLPDLLAEDELASVKAAIRLLSAYHNSKDLVDVGAYRPGNNLELDRALRILPALETFLTQAPDEITDRPESVKKTQDNNRNQTGGRVRSNRGKSGYPLEALLKIRRIDLDHAQVAILKARGELDRITNQQQLLAQTIQSVESELRELCESGGVIDQGRHQAMITFLTDRQLVMKEMTQEVKRAEQHYEQTRSQLGQARQGVKVLEKHKDKQIQERVRETARKEQLTVDDLWLRQTGRAKITRHGTE